MAITRGLTTLADVKLSLNLAAAVTVYDTDLEFYIGAATPVIEDITGPMYAESRTVYFDGGTNALLLPFRINALTTLTVDGTVSTAYVADKRAGIIYAGTTGRDCFPKGIQNISALVTVGNATVPPNVVVAARELVRHWWQNGRQGTGPAGPAAETPNAPAPISGVMTRRLNELLAANPGLGGFA